MLEEFTRELKIFNDLSEKISKIFISVNDDNSFLSSNLRTIKNLLLNLNSEDLKSYIASSDVFKKTIESFYSSEKN